MSVLKAHYFCHECKKVVDKVEGLLFVEDDSARGFCSESCIEKFFSPIVRQYEEHEKKSRKELGLLDEKCLKRLNNQEFLKKTLTRPDEVYMVQNDLKDEIYSFTKKFDDFKVIILCSVFEGQPAFIFLATATASDELLQSFQSGKKIEDLNEFVKEESAENEVEMELDEETISALEIKKSRVLAKLLECQGEDDIPYEEYENYSDCFNATMERPDEVYELVDEDGDTIYHYIRGHEKDGESFFFFVICMKYDTHWAQQAETVLPIISFPSRESQVVEFFRTGEKVSGVLKN